MGTQSFQLVLTLGTLFLGSCSWGTCHPGPHSKALTWKACLSPANLGVHTEALGGGCFTSEILGISCLGAPGISSHPYVGGNQTGIMIMFFAMSNYKKQMSKEPRSLKKMQQFADLDTAEFTPH